MTRARSVGALLDEAATLLPPRGSLSLSGPYGAWVDDPERINWHVTAYSGETRTIEAEGEIEPYGVHVTVNGGAIEHSVWFGAGYGPSPAAALRDFIDRAGR